MRGTCKRSQVACRRETNEWNFLQAVVSSLEKAKSRFEAVRENPTPDAHWALWIDCMKEPAQKFFSLHRTAKRDDAQKRLSTMRCKLVSEQVFLPAKFQWLRSRGSMTLPSRILKCCAPMSCYQWHDMFQWFCAHD